MFRPDPSSGISPVIWRVVKGGAAVQNEPLSAAAQLEQKFQEGKQRGYTEAIAAASREAELQLQPVLGRLARAIQELADERARVRQETAIQLVKLSTAIAARILHREITLDPDAIHGLLRAAFDKVQSREVTRFAVHPDHAAAVRRFLEQTGKRIEITSDPTLAPGEITIRTAQGEIDVAIETQLKEIERGLADRLDT